VFEVAVIDSLLVGLNQLCFNSGRQVSSPSIFCAVLPNVFSTVISIFTYKSVYQSTWTQLRAPDNSENQINCRSFMLPLWCLEYADDFYWKASGLLVYLHFMI